MNKERAAVFARAKALWEKNKVDDAWDLVRPQLAEDPWDADMLAIGGSIYEKAGNLPVAYHFFKQSTQVAPMEANHWVNFGRVAEELWRVDEAERAYKIALKRVNRDETLKILLGNIACLCIDNARYEEAEQWCAKGLAKFPDFDLCKSNLGFAQLALGKWDVGWKNYHYCLGTTSRTKFVYKDEPEWDGTPGKSVVLYGEQGIGDELSFASMVPDAIRDCEKVIIDCDIRLAGLFSRSFPKARVYGTRKAPHDCALWAKEDRTFDASLSIGQIGEFYRLKPEDCPGTPYLVPDPERVLMWRALWATKKKPVIGIAWQGGIPGTGAKFRRWSLEELLPVFRSIDAHWVCLEYKPAAGTIAAFKAKHPEIDLKEYPHATLTTNYDDTAGLVASLDMVFCMQTSVAHLATAMGVKTWVCVPPKSQWRYGSKGDTIPWYKSMRVIRQVKDKWDFATIGAELASQFSGEIRNAA